MKKYKWILLGGVNLLLFAGLIAYGAKKLASSDKVRQESVTTVKSAIGNLENVTKEIIRYSDLPFDTELAITTNENVLTRLSRVVNTADTTFILLYPGHNCSLCFQEDMNRVKALGKEIGMNRIVLLTTALTQKELFFFLKNHDIAFNGYVVTARGEHPLLANIDRPAFFMLTPGKLVASLFVPDPDFPGLSDAYLDMVRARYFHLNVKPQS
ncbi:hypothetical protein MKQ68_09175 [Chitinophaga horti]|uniref:AhpC/TSA family protein n=1 Tax=Chitinophaga horti TaxID=2920382 RepID=A0ABY6JAB2_9BACT|nr:hypothetical protein [Chitinophaga horti]UYQ95267.1 hypothetical protein MKQ68_09175 [Chitinophaga horti]